MNAELKANKAILRDFMQKHYTDQKLAELLAHAQDGKLVYDSCCCFHGVSSALPGHALRGENRGWEEGYPGHLSLREFPEGWDRAGVAFLLLAPPIHRQDETRRRILIPMIRAEMKRRAFQSPAALASVADQTHDGRTFARLDAMVEEAESRVS